MSILKLGEINVVGQFVPEIFFLCGLMALGTRTVWFKPEVIVPTVPELTTLAGPGEDAKRYGYYFHAHGFDPKSAAAIIKSNLSGLLVATLLLELVVNYSLGETPVVTSYFSGMLSHSPLVVLFKILVLAFMWMAVLYADSKEIGLSASTLMLVGTVVFFMLVLVSANNFIVFYVALEGLSLILFVLTAQPKTQTAVESGLKYFFQSSFASILLLLGIALVFASTQDFDFISIRWALIQDPLTEFSVLGLSIITVALLFKVSAFPGHFGAPDVYRGPIASVLTVFAVGVKLAAFLALFNVYTSLLVYVHTQFSGLLYISSAASMLLGALGAIRVINERGDIRTFVAYTSINQAGFVLLGLTCVSAEGFLASLIYLIVYLLASLLFVGVLSRVRFGLYGERTVSRLDDLRQLFGNEHKFSRRLDLLVVAYAVWSMAGLPPLAGFFGKVALGSALLNKMNDLVSGQSWSEVHHSFKFVDAAVEFDPFLPLAAILVFSIVVSIISAAYYFKLYELMAPAASETQARVQLNVPTVYMMHDRGSIILTAGLIVMLVSGIGVVYWTQTTAPFAFAVELFDLNFGLDINTSDFVI